MKKQSPATAVVIKKKGPDKWQQILANGISSPAELMARLQLKPEDLKDGVDANSPFRMRVPEPFVSRMQKGNSEDPLLLQVLAMNSERVQADGFARDPLAEKEQMVAKGVLHKYPGRVLLAVTGACAVHCRYCFRRHFPYAEAVPGRHSWQMALDYIGKTQAIREVILSGGDPLMLKDAVLGDLIRALSRISHVETLRIHTRLPIVVPQRVTRALLDTLAIWPRTTVLAVHANHPAEIDSAVHKGLERLADSVDWLLNQSVLLANINDDSAVLTELSRRLFAAKTLPYYLHALDKVTGAAHFEVPVSTGRAIMKSLREQLPGYLVPAFVTEVPHTLSKQPL